MNEWCLMRRNRRTSTLSPSRPSFNPVLNTMAPATAFLIYQVEVLISGATKNTLRRFQYGGFTQLDVFLSISIEEEGYGKPLFDTFVTWEQEDEEVSREQVGEALNELVNIFGVGTTWDTYGSAQLIIHSIMGKTTSLHLPLHTPVNF